MSIVIKDSRLAPGSGDRLVSRQEGFESGRNGNFDIALIERAAGHYDLEIFMKIQFYFIDGDEDDSNWATATEYEWSADERKKFMVTWYSNIKAAWSKRKIAVLSNKKPMSVCLQFYLQEAGWMWDHFEIDVIKIPAAGKHATSYVDRSVFSADVVLDSKDFVAKASGQKAAIHEFGHMLGLPDEYKSSSAHFSDKTSIMNSGTTVKARHFNHLVTWAEKQIKP